MVRDDDHAFFFFGGLGGGVGGLGPFSFSAMCSRFFAYITLLSSLIVCVTFDDSTLMLLKLDSDSRSFIGSGGGRSSSLTLESVVPMESRLLLVPELLAALMVSDKLDGLEEYWPLDGLLSLFSFSTSERNGRLEVNSCRSSMTGVPPFEMLLVTVLSASGEAMYHWALPVLVMESVLLDLRLSFCDLLFLMVGE